MNIQKRNQAKIFKNLIKKHLPQSTNDQIKSYTKMFKILMRYIFSLFVIVLIIAFTLL